MSGHGASWVAFGLALSIPVFVLVEFYRHQIVQKSKRRAKLEQANTFLHVHTHSMEEFMQFAEPSDRLKRFLIDYSEQMSSEDAANRLIHRAGLIGAGNMEPSPHSELILFDLETLRDTRPGQADIFEKVIRCGLFAALSRWPSAEGAFDRAFAYLVVDQKHQIDRTVRATDQTHQSQPKSSAMEALYDNDLVTI